MKTDLVSLMATIATKKARPAVEDDNPWFFGDGVWAIDLKDAIVMFGHGEDGSLTVFCDTFDGCVQYDLAVTCTLNELED